MYYVVWRRSNVNNFDMISVYDRDEAVDRKWIDPDTGSRIWVVPADLEQYTITMVFEFDSLDEAVKFHEGFKHQLGRKVVEDV